MPAAPVATFLLGPNSAAHGEFFPDPDGAELAPNVTYLGTLRHLGLGMPTNRVVTYTGTSPTWVRTTRGTLHTIVHKTHPNIDIH